jgi:hypothetical protein
MSRAPIRERITARAAAAKRLNSGRNADNLRSRLDSNHRLVSNWEPRRLAGFFVSMTGLLLAGCASVMRVDSDVQSHTQWVAPPLGTVQYVFERTPSQTANPLQQPQAAAEAATQSALRSKGWVLNERSTETSAAVWRVQVMASVATLVRPNRDDLNDPFWLIRERRPGGFRRTPWLMPEPAMHRRQLTLWVRDGVRGEVAFEATAVHEGPWNESTSLWLAIAQAALDGFPTPPPGARRVMIDAPR